jgi:hypothetical protein
MLPHFATGQLLGQGCCLESQCASTIVLELQIESCAGAGGTVKTSWVIIVILLCVNEGEGTVKVQGEVGHFQRVALFIFATARKVVAVARFRQKRGSPPLHFSQAPITSTKHTSPWSEKNDTRKVSVALELVCSLQTRTRIGDNSSKDCVCLFCIIQGVGACHVCLTKF